tara:strand:- start:4748 stop:5596 length:849 start_codon:yes stop_codon:yes gene_type:complete
MDFLFTNLKKGTKIRKKRLAGGSSPPQNPSTKLPVPTNSIYQLYLGTPGSNVYPAIHFTFVSFNSNTVSTSTENFDTYTDITSMSVNPPTSNPNNTQTLLPETTYQQEISVPAATANMNIGQSAGIPIIIGALYKFNTQYIPSHFYDYELTIVSSSLANGAQLTPFANNNVQGPASSVPNISNWPAGGKSGWHIDPFFTNPNPDTGIYGQNYSFSFANPPAVTNLNCPRLVIQYGGGKGSQIPLQAGDTFTLNLKAGLDFNANYPSATTPIFYNHRIVVTLV